MSEDSKKNPDTNPLSNEFTRSAMLTGVSEHQFETEFRIILKSAENLMDAEAYSQFRTRTELLALKRDVDRGNVLLETRKELAKVLWEIDGETEGSSDQPEKVGKILTRKGADGKFRNSPEAQKYFDRFVFGSATLADCSNRQIGDILSYVYANSSPDMSDFAGKRDENAYSNLQSKLARDPRGLIKISENWGTKNGIDRKLQIEAKNVNAYLLEGIREGFVRAVSGEVSKFVSALPEVSDRTGLEAALADVIRNLKPNGNDYFQALNEKTAQSMRKYGVPESFLRANRRESLNFVRAVLELTQGRKTVESNLQAEKYPDIKGVLESVASVSDSELPALLERLRAQYLKDPDRLAAIENAAGLRNLRRTNAAISSVAGGTAIEGKTFSNRTSEMVAAKLAKSGDAGFAKSAESGAYERSARADRTLRTFTPEQFALLKTLLEKSGAKSPESIWSLTSQHVTSAVSALRLKSQRTPEEAALLAKLDAYASLELEARREYVAEARGVSYDDVIRLEKRGTDIDTLYASAKMQFEDALSGGSSKFASGAESASDVVRHFARSESKPGDSVWIAFPEASSGIGIEMTSDRSTPYRIVAADGTGVFFCSQENLAAHLDLAGQFLRIGLERYLFAAPEILKRVSAAEGRLITARDAEFSNLECGALLRVLARTFGVPEFPYASTEVSELEAGFRRATASGFSLAATARVWGFESESGRIDRQRFFERVSEAA